MLCCFCPSNKTYFDIKEKKHAEKFFANHTLETPSVSMNGVKSWCRVVDVYDGDSLTIVLPFKQKKHVCKFAVRLSGVDACEMNSKLSENRYKAVKARDRVIQLVTGTNTIPTFKTRKDVQGFLNEKVYVVWIECYCMDKYKRVLADVYPAQCTESISATLVKENLAYTYHGKTKLSEEQQLDVLAPVVP
jgi:endonuclease YncB( thermonuclease family)